MCDFHDFGLTFFSPYCVFALLKMSKNVFWVVARLHQRLKSTFLEIFSSLYWSVRNYSTQKNFQKIDYLVPPNYTFFQVHVFTVHMGRAHSRCSTACPCTSDLYVQSWDSFHRPVPDQWFCDQGRKDRLTLKIHQA